MKYLLSLIFFFIFSIASAQNFTGKYSSWSVYTVSKDGRKLCYMVSYPVRKTGNYSNRGEPYIMVTNVSGVAKEVSVTGGYKYKSGTEPRAIVDGKEYRMSLTKGEFAWFKTSGYDKKLIKKMKAGMRMRIKGTSTIGTYSIDTYSLRGFTEAYNKMNRSCS